MLTILNDVHIGAQRSAGTTPFTQMGLKNHIRDTFKSLLPPQGDLLILGDLFDSFNVSIYDVLETYKVLSEWLNAGQRRLWNVAGNHDLSKTSNVLSSFQFLGHLLAMQFPASYIHVEQATEFEYGYIIPHVRNQDLFDIELSKVPAGAKFLFVHCNIDNKFAAQSDQSLNMSAEQIASCPARQIICAHEHHYRLSAGGKVVLPGNQIATSVADWLPEVDKRYLVIEYDFGVDDFTVTEMTAAQRIIQFTEMDWKAMQVTDHMFVRVTGEAQPAEVSGAITAVNKLRAKHPAFVIANAIKTVADNDSSEVFSQSLESVQQFSVMDALRKILTADQYAIVEGVFNAPRN